MKQHFFKLGKNTIIYGVGTMLTRFISLLLLPLFTAYLTPADFGVIALLALLGAVLQPIFSLGLNAGMGPCYFENNNEKRKATTVWTAFSLLSASSLCLVTIAWLFPEILSRLLFQKPDYSWLVSLSVTGVALNILSTPFRMRLQFEEKAVWFVTLTLVSTLVTISLSVLMVVGMEWGVQGIILGQLIGFLINMLLFMFFSSRFTRFYLDKSIGEELLRLGLPLVPSFAFLFILMQSNQYILKWFRGLDEVGIYSIGFRLGMVMTVVVGAFQTAWYPFFMSYMTRQDEAKILFGRIFTYYIFGVGSLSLLFFIFAKPIVMILTQPEFHSAYQVVGLSASAQFFSGLFILLVPGIYFAKELKYVSIIQGTAAFISLILNITLISWIGLFGAGLALCLGYLTMVIFQQAWNRMRQSDYIEIVYEWRRVFKFAVLYLLIAVISLLKRDWTLLHESFFSAMLFVLLLVAVYRFFDLSEREFAWALPRRVFARILS